MRRRLFFTCVEVLVVTAGSVLAADEPYDPDLEFLKESKVATDGAGLVKYLAARSGHDDDLLRVDGLIRQLGNSDFQARRQAAVKLIAVGPPAHARLLEAQKDKDPERARGARQTAEAINRAWNFGLNLTVVRRLVKLAHSPGGKEKGEGETKSPLAPGGRGDAGEGDVAKALLQFLPYAADEDCEEEIWFGLDSLAKAQPQLIAAIANSLKDKLPIRRAAAGYLFTRRGNADQRPAGKKLLADPDPLVRLRAAQGLLGAKDKDAIPILIELLEKLRWTEEAWQAEELLHYVAGDDAPEATIGVGFTESRQKCRKAWERWWERNGSKIDLAKLDQEFRRPVLIVLRTRNDDPANRMAFVCLVGCLCRAHWSVQLFVPDAQLLPRDRLLVTQRKGDNPPNFNRGSGVEFVIGVTERDLTGKVIWSAPGTYTPEVAFRLPNGNTLFPYLDSLLELTPEGGHVNEPFKRSLVDDRGRHMFFANCRRLPNGSIICTAHPSRTTESLGEFDPITGRLVRRIELQDKLEQGRIEPLPNGHFLIASAPSGRVIEVDHRGRTVWDFKTIGPNKAVRLRNGNTLIACGRIIEITPLGQTVWETYYLPCREDNLCLTLELVRLGFDTPRPSDPALWLARLSNGLRNKEAMIRKGSAWALERLGPKAEPAIPELLRTLNDPDELVQQASCDALRAIGAASFQPLLEATSDSRGAVRLWAVRTLSGFKNQSKAVVPVFIKKLRDNDLSMRREAAMALSGFVPESPEMIPALIEALKDKDEAKNLQEWSVPQIAVQALRRFGPKARVAVPALIEALNTRDVYLRGSTIATLGEMGPHAKVAIPAVLNVLDTHGSGESKEAVYTRCCVAAFLAQIGGPETQSAIPALIDILKKKDLHPAYRQSAAKALGKMGSKAVSAVAALKEAVSDDDDGVRNAAGQALEAITGELRK